MMARILLGILGFYRSWVSPGLHVLSPSGCKFHPSCSQYAAEAIAMHGAGRGGWIAVRRLLRCHPFSRGGFDPVPMADRSYPGDKNKSMARVGHPFRERPEPEGPDGFACLPGAAAPCSSGSTAAPSVTVEVSAVDLAHSSLNHGRAGQTRRNPAQRR